MATVRLMPVNGCAAAHAMSRAHCASAGGRIPHCKQIGTSYPVQRATVKHPDTPDCRTGRGPDEAGRACDEPLESGDFLLTSSQALTGTAGAQAAPAGLRRLMWTVHGVATPQT